MLSSFLLSTHRLFSLEQGVLEWPKISQQHTFSLRLFAGTRQGLKPSVDASEYRVNIFSFVGHGVLSQLRSCAAVGSKLPEGRFKLIDVTVF